MIASIVAKFIVLTWLFRHLLNWNGLRMFQISAKINIKTKYEGFSNRPCTKHNEEQRKSRRVSEWQSKLLTLKFPRKHVLMTKKMLIYSIISFVSGFFFLWTFWQRGQFRSFRYASFVLMFFYANVSVLMVTMKYHFMIGCRAHDHNLAGVVLITWRSLSLKTHDDYLFQGMFF